MTIQDRIKYIQSELGISQKEFAEGINVPPGSVTDWYKKGVTPRSDKIVRLVDAFSVNPFYILKGEGPPFLTRHKWSENDEQKFRKKYYQLLYLINHYKKSDLIKGFYNTLNIKNWREELDQKLGKLLFGGLYSLAKRFNVSPNLLLVEAYSGIFFNMMKNLAKDKKLSAEQLYVLAVGCNYHSEDLKKIFPDNPLSYLNKKDLYAQIEFQTRIKYKIYGLKEMAQEKKLTSNSAFFGIQQSFKQLDQIIKNKETPNYCEIDRHDYFYWSNCPICKKTIDSPSMNYDFDFSNISLDNEMDFVDLLALDVCEALSNNEKSGTDFIERFKQLCLDS